MSSIFRRKNFICCERCINLKTFNKMIWINSKFSTISRHSDSIYHRHLSKSNVGCWKIQIEFLLFSILRVVNFRLNWIFSLCLCAHMRARASGSLKFSNFPHKTQMKMRNDMGGWQLRREFTIRISTSLRLPNSNNLFIIFHFSNCDNWTFYEDIL